MAFRIVRDDIMKVKADMVVTQADLPGSDGLELDKKRIRECYRNSLKRAKEMGDESIALPLIDGRHSGLSESDVIREASSVFRDFLEQEDMQITLVVPKKISNAPRAEQYAGIDAYLERYYVAEPTDAAIFDEKPPKRAKRGFLGLNSIIGRRSRKGASAARYAEETPMPDVCEEAEYAFERDSAEADSFRTEKDLATEDKRAETDSFADAEEERSEDGAEDFIRMAPAKPGLASGMAPDAKQGLASGMSLAAKPGLASEMASAAKPGRTLEDLMAHMSDTWQESLLHLIDEKGYTDTEVYKRANIDRKLFSKIRSNSKYQPKKNTALALALALHLNLDETKDLLGRAGYALSPSSKSDLIIRYFIENEVYDIYTINLALFDHQQPILGE